MDSILFNEAEHTYTRNGLLYTPVSDILREAGLVDLSGVPADILEDARVRGTYVHKATEYDDQGLLNYNTLVPKYAPYLFKWQEFKKKHNIKILEIEKKVYADNYLIAGTIDRIALFMDKISIIDIKTGAAQPGVKIQLAGYRFLYEQMTGKTVDQLVSVSLKDIEAKYQVYDYYKNEWLSAVVIYQFKQKNKLTKKGN